MRLTVPYTDNRELQEISKVLSSGYLTQGKKVTEFERLVSRLIKCKYAFAMSSCTTSLHLALVALGITAKDEVLVADFTFPATGNVVAQQGAIPVLVDINLDTFTINTDDLCSKITKRTKAIIPVHTFGCSADMRPIMQIAAKLRIPVIEDAACALGATYYGRYCGNIGTMGCFSFHPRKVITTGEGGMITTNDSELAKRIQLLRNHGGKRINGWNRYDAAGFNYRLSDIQAAMGVAQMEKLREIILRRKMLAHDFRSILSSIDGIKLTIEPLWGGHIYQSFVILLDSKINRNRIIKRLNKQRIEVTLGTYALHAQPFYRKEYGYAAGQLPNSYIAFKQSISLPFYPQMKEKELHLIAGTLKAAIKNN